MGEDRGNRLKRNNICRNPDNSGKPEAKSILNRWKIGCRITPELIEKTKEAMRFLEEIENAAETDRNYTNARYQGKESREKMRVAELMRAGSMLHAVFVTKSLILKAFEQDDPDNLELAVTVAQIMKDHILERGFFRLFPPNPQASSSPIKKIEPDPNTAEGWAMGLRQRIERTYRFFVYEPLMKPCEAMGILLCPFEQLVDGTPIPPTLNISKA